MTCTCTYATAANTKSVRDGFEMGGYLLRECDECRAADEALRQEALANAPTHAGVHDLMQEVYQALSSDLETGSHHLNNEASETFGKKYPALCAALTQLASYIEPWGPD